MFNEAQFYKMLCTLQEFSDLCSDATENKIQPLQVSLFSQFNKGCHIWLMCTGKHSTVVADIKKLACVLFA